MAKRQPGRERPRSKRTLSAYSVGSALTGHPSKATRYLRCSQARSWRMRDRSGELRNITERGAMRSGVPRQAEVAARRG